MASSVFLSIMIVPKKLRLSKLCFIHTMNTVNVDIFAQYIFLRISRRALDV